MPSNTAKRGESRLGCLATLLIAGLLAVGVVGLVKSEMRYRSARDALRAEARELQSDRPHQMRDLIALKARELELSVNPAEVRVDRSPGTTAYVITLTYPDTLAFPGFNWVRLRRMELETR